MATEEKLTKIHIREKPVKVVITDDTVWLTIGHGADGEPSEQDIVIRVGHIPRLTVEDERERRSP
jgi:hypothetical protein